MARGVERYTSGTQGEVRTVTVRKDGSLRPYQQEAMDHVATLGGERRSLMRVRDAVRHEYESRKRAAIVAATPGGRRQRRRIVK